MGELSYLTEVSETFWCAKFNTVYWSQLPWYGFL